MILLYIIAALAVAWLAQKALARNNQKPEDEARRRYLGTNKRMPIIQNPSEPPPKRKSKSS